MKKQKQKEQTDAMPIKNCSVKLARIPPDELAQYMENVVLVDVPVRRLTKRNKRVMSCVDPFCFEEKDKYQENDSNPVMQPSSNQNQFIKKNQNEIPLVPDCESNRTVNGQNEQIIVAAENQCAQCFVYKQNIIQLKKRIKKMQNEYVVYMAQYDNLQDRCFGLMEKNVKCEI